MTWQYYTEQDRPSVRPLHVLVGASSIPPLKLRFFDYYSSGFEYVCRWRFFLRLSSLDTSSWTYFPLYKLALRPASTPDTSRHRSSISPPRNHVAFSFTRQVSFGHSISSPRLLLLREGKNLNIQTNDRQIIMTRQKISLQFVIDRSSVRPDHDHGQRCSAAFSLATASTGTGTALLPSQMLQIACYVANMLCNTPPNPVCNNLWLGSVINPRSRQRRYILSRLLGSFKWPGYRWPA